MLRRSSFSRPKKYTRTAYSNSEFSQIAEEKGIEKVFPVLDELMQTIAVLNPRLYQSVIRKLEEV